MDVPEPPRIVFEQTAACSDASRADDLLRRALAPSRAPATGWTVSVTVTRVGTSLHAEGEITDEHEAAVAHRVMDHDGHDCSSLAKAAGVWASLVLDEEVERAKTAVKPAPPVEAPMVMWPAPSPPEKPSPEAQLFLKHGLEERSLELGLGTYLMGGTGAGIVAGPTAFAIVEAGNAWFLQPGVSFGRTVQELKPSSDVYGTWGSGRFDACKRLPGNYLDHRGIQLDLCGGADLGFLHFDAPSVVAGTPAAKAIGSGRTIPIFAVGPSIALRGELGSGLSVIVRGVVGMNVIREAFVDAVGTNVEPELFTGRGEVGLTWRLR